jgi:hypothetical protein
MVIPGFLFWSKFVLTASNRYTYRYSFALGNLLRGFYVKSKVTLQVWAMWPDNNLKRQNTTTGDKTVFVLVEPT